MNTQPKVEFPYDISTGEYRVYIACLASYNDGRLFGQWMDVDSDLHENIAAMLEASPVRGAEEWAIHDYELPFTIGEYEDIDSLVERVEDLESLSDYERAGYEAYLDYYSTGTVEQFRDAYQGAYRTPLEFTESYVDDMGVLDEVPEGLRYYFDMEAYSRDQFDDGYTFSNGHVFLD